MMSVFAKRRQVVSAEALSGGEPNAGNNGCVWGRGGGVDRQHTIPYGNTDLCQSVCPHPNGLHWGYSDMGALATSFSLL